MFNSLIEVNKILKEYTGDEYTQLQMMIRKKFL